MSVVTDTHWTTLSGKVLVSHGQSNLSTTTEVLSSRDLSSCSLSGDRWAWFRRWRWHQWRWHRSFLWDPRWWLLHRLSQVFASYPLLWNETFHDTTCVENGDVYNGGGDNPTPSFQDKTKRLSLNIAPGFGFGEWFVHRSRSNPSANYVAV